LSKATVLEITRVTAQIFPHFVSSFLALLALGKKMYHHSDEDSVIFVAWKKTILQYFNNFLLGIVDSNQNQTANYRKQTAVSIYQNKMDAALVTATRLI